MGSLVAPFGPCFLGPAWEPGRWGLVLSMLPRAGPRAELPATRPTPGPPPAVTSSASPLPLAMSSPGLRASGGPLAAYRPTSLPRSSMLPPERLTYREETHLHLDLFKLLQLLSR